MKITWYKKKAEGRKNHKSADVTVHVSKKGTAYVTLRNDFAKEISPESEHIILGVSDVDKNILVFMAGSAEDGWKAQKYDTMGAPTTSRIIITDKETVATLSRFEGDYNMELYSDIGSELYAINRRSVI